MRPPRYPEGFLAGGIAAGIKPSGRRDLGMILCEGPALAVALTTTHRFPAAPVVLLRRRLARPRPIHGLIVNSGNANAVTGAEGLRDARALLRQAERLTGRPRGSFLMASTGKIGERLPVAKILAGLEVVRRGLSCRGWPALAEAILTTDTRPKLSRRTARLEDGSVRTVLGLAKGAGMVQPDLATMLAFFATDFPVTPALARRALKAATDASFHCLTIDGQTSTNDTVLLLGSRPAPPGAAPSTEEARRFARALLEVARELAEAIAGDGEGATKRVTIEVRGARDRASARRLGRAVANSALVKTAIYGEDPNWGRIVQALGQVRPGVQPGRVSIRIQGVRVLEAGRAKPFDRRALRRAMAAREITIHVAVGRGRGRCRLWTCDLSPDYVRINAEYN